MTNFLVTPNMNLPNPVPGVDPGPDYADNLQSCMVQIDQHNHSAGQGVQIQPNGININSDLPFNSNNATLLNSVRFVSLLSPLASSAPNIGCLYVSGNELYYNDYSGGNQIQITLNGTVNATSSGISSGTATAAFSAGTLVVKSSSTSFANIDMQSAILANAGNIINQLTLQAPTLSSSYDITLPTIPAQTNVMTLDSSGNMGSITYDAVGQDMSSVGANAIGASMTSSGANALGSHQTVLAKNAQSGSNNVVVSNTNATNSLAIIRGAVTSGGSITSGEGFSVSHPSTGNYTITFSTAFADVPSISLSGNASGPIIFNIPSSSSGGFSFQSVNITNTFADAAFMLIAIGQRA